MHTPYSDKPAGRPRPVRRRKWSRESGSIMVMFTMMMPFTLIPLVGTAVDGSILYSVKAKLQAAVDGAAIAAASSLNLGGDINAQAISAAKAAQSYIKANFQQGYWGTYNLYDGTYGSEGSGQMIDVEKNDVSALRTVSIHANVQTPLLFTRLMGFTSMLVAAAGQSSRRDVVLVMVLDRSGSMSAELTAIQQASTYFTSLFSQGRDHLGLVLIGGSSLVAYPSGDWNNTAPLGPRTSFGTDNPSLSGQISIVKSGSNTGTADGLSLAYQELAATAATGALNVIVLFTDGMPNGITANFNGNNPGGFMGTVSGGQGTTASNNKGSSVRTLNYYPTKSSCTNSNDGGALGGSAGLSMVGWMAQDSGYTLPGPTKGIFRRDQFNTDYSLTTLINNPNDDQDVIAKGAGTSGVNCSFAHYNSSSQQWDSTNAPNVSLDVTIPDYDYWGNSTKGSGTNPYTTNDYKSSVIYKVADACDGTANPKNYDGWFYNANVGDGSITKGPASGCQVGLASWNATDMAAMNIRTDPAGIKPVIYALGYEGNALSQGDTSTDDPILMMRLANINDPSNTVYNKNHAQGMYIAMQSTADIGPAFVAVASQILRLSF